jgi:hypothetical protein
VRTTEKLLGRKSTVWGEVPMGRYFPHIRCSDIV